MNEMKTRTKNIDSKTKAKRIDLSQLDAQKPNAINFVELKVVLPSNKNLTNKPI